MQSMERQFRTIEPKILYFGTPVALVSSLNEDGSTNLAPISSFWALGWTLMLGLLGWFFTHPASAPPEKHNPFRFKDDH